MIIADIHVRPSIGEHGLKPGYYCAREHRQ